MAVGLPYGVPRRLICENRKSNRLGDCFFIRVHLQKAWPFDISANKKVHPP